MKKAGYGVRYWARSSDMGSPSDMFDMGSSICSIWGHRYGVRSLIMTKVNDLFTSTSRTRGMTQNKGSAST